MKTRQQRQSEHGAVALFVVIFATLLMIIITISFIQLMIKDQQQATASDLSQSAYDSATSGVEDAKRLLLLDQACRNNTAPAAVNCVAVATAIDSNDCDTVSSIFGNPGDSETLVQQDAGDRALQQAYTCVKINANTADYMKQLGVNESDIVPLRGTNTFNKVRLSWFTRADISATTNSMAVGFPSSGGNYELPRVGTRWAANYPALLRAQLMQSGGSFTLADYDNEKNASTLFLYPAAVGTTTPSFVTVRRDGLQTPEVVDCETTFSASAIYACTVTIDVPAPADGNVVNRNAFLRLSALYNGAHYKLELLNGNTVVSFDHVQPEVDSTGRANDMFRRVKSRIDYSSPFNYPEAAVDIEGDLCKSFVITDQDAQYVASPTCTP